MVLAVLALPAWTLPARAASQTASVSVDVTPGRWEAVRLRNLPGGAALSVAVKGTPPVAVLLVDQAGCASYPDVRRPLFRGEVRETLSFSIKIPKKQNYCLVFDNRAGTAESRLDVVIRAARGADIGLPSRGDASKEPDEAPGASLDRIGTELGKLLVFDPFPIRAVRCGKAGAFSGPDGVLLCLEFVEKVQKTLGDREKASAFLLFATFHEMGHVLLKQWGYPFYDNEEVADEFAAMLFVMLGRGERLSATAEYFVASPSSAELLNKALRNDRHPLSIQRARNILEWMKDSGRVRRWQAVLVPHMQTAALELIRKTPPAWADRSLVDKELAARKGAAR